MKCLTELEKGVTQFVVGAWLTLLLVHRRSVRLNWFLVHWSCSSVVYSAICFYLKFDLLLPVCTPPVIRYEGERRMRVGAIHGFARMAAIMASTYKGYLGEGLGPLEEPLMKLKIPHPGKVGGYFAMTPTMPTMLAWVLGGNYKNLEGRAPYCSLDSKVSSRREAEGARRWRKQIESVAWFFERTQRPFATAGRSCGMRIGAAEPDKRPANRSMRKHTSSAICYAVFLQCCRFGREA